MNTVERAAAAAGLSAEQFRAVPRTSSTPRGAVREPARRGSGATSSASGVALRERASQSAEDLTQQLTSAFRRLGLSPESAGVAARGRAGRPKASGLAEAGARTFARGRGLREAVTDGSGFLAGDYAYAPDLEDPTTWKLLLVKQPGDGALGAYDNDLVRAAAAALAVPDYGVDQVVVPKTDLAAVKQTVRGAWIQAGLPQSDMPPALAEEALRHAFRRLGMSEPAATVAAEGRGRRW